MSNAGLTVEYLYFKNIGLIVFSEKKAPFLNFKRLVPFDVAPSGNIKNGAYYPVFSINSCLYYIYYNTSYLLRSSPPLGMYIESITSIKVQSRGTP
jgi:hypothetical protein